MPFFGATVRDNYCDVLYVAVGDAESTRGCEDRTCSFRNGKSKSAVLPVPVLNTEVRPD